MEFLQSLDLGTLFWFGPEHHHPWLDVVMETATRLGNTGPLALVVLLGVLGFICYKQRRAAVLLLVLGPGSHFLSEAVKDYVRRPRPDVGWRKWDLPTSESFPSGHAFCSMAIYGGIALLTARRLRRRSLAAVVVGAALAVSLLVGTSRMYLGVHYLTDVAGGWTAGLACALLTMWVDKRWSLADPATVPLATPEMLPQKTAPEHVGASTDRVSRAS
jgi:undecaprenyl-diphosphatase